ncbi:hypothetical protein VN12_16270 [Pirellula sp. SH-Sr6A]|uniref:hypothetical protein n=1 Tax=Pirellula sp. SH-Sr6A TaxID=1632865 RepID=UPI00078B9715|nr:hypothetical protein [Pirellula sp. SH-Sr6A]AMV33685.1 hypothetical protein VN12_16270 [Pirellula sp. SH-Sr6A]
MKAPFDVDRYVCECNRFQRRVLVIAIGTVLFMMVCFGLVIPFRDNSFRIVANWHDVPAAESD